MAGMDGISQIEVARMGFPTALDPHNRPQIAKPRPRLKIVFVDSRSRYRSTSLRRNPTRAVQRSHRLSFTAELDAFGDDADANVHYIQLEASEDESDQDYYEDEANSTKRPRAGRNMWRARKQKRHGRLAVADRDLIFEARQGRLANEPPKDMATRIAKPNAVDLVSRLAKAANWAQAVAIQDGLVRTSRQPLVESEEQNSVRESVLSKTEEDTALSDHRLKQYWSDILVSSGLEMET